ncbi:MAG: cobyrinate a,c-diamide synthase [Gammaproteobacteria bacterium]|nr:cobyrinate a,c-diamide synthase [Gammaproteobacteria bacterium]
MTHPARHCPALFISAPASGQGKTTITAGLARLYRNQGHRVRVFKTGPDFLDPMILERASGNPVYQLDQWMGGEDHCRELLYKAAAEADVILVEGVMGLYDGTPSSADLAQRFNIPAMTVISATAMAQTFGAIVHGLATYRTTLAFAGVFANHVGSASHAALLAESLPKNISLLGTMPRDEQLSLPSRHLGLVQAQELADLDERLDRIAAALAETALAQLPAVVTFTAPAETTTLPKLLKGVRIAVAQDAAFSFIYPANLDTLRALGAELRFFSPLTDHTLPEADALYLPGGYPELHLQVLADNHAMQTAICDHHAAGKPIVAECGGMLYLLESLADSAGTRAKMTGLLPGHATLQKKLANLGLHSVTLPEGQLRGHSFHHSQMETSLSPIATSQPQRKRGQAEAVYRIGRLQASYLHLYFPSAPEVAARLFS